MTALQWIVKEAKALKKKYPKRFKTWTEYVKQASAIYASKHKGKSPVGKKKTVTKKRAVKGTTTKKVVAKKAVAKKRPVKSLHKDTKSHNVNIRVVSGTTPHYLAELNRYVKLLKEYENALFRHNSYLKKARSLKDKVGIKSHTDLIKQIKKEIVSIKKHIVVLKRNIK